MFERCDTRHTSFRFQCVLFLKVPTQGRAEVRFSVRFKSGSHHAIGRLCEQDPLHIGLRPVSHRQRLGRRIGAVYQYGGIPGHGESGGYALIYPIAVPAVCFVLSLFLMPETKQNKIWESGPATA
jgi:hypothetical protein